MKHLLALMALCVAFAAGAQTWNPDADFDNVIGVNDLMALLTVFGSEWTAEYPQDPEYDLAAYYAGEFKLGDCIAVCASNHAKIISTWEFALFRDSALTASGYEEIIENPCVGCGCTSGAGVSADFHLRTKTWYGWWQHAQSVSCGENFMNSTFISHPHSGSPNSSQNFHCVCSGLIPTID